jgi:hypothetical protein
MTQRSVAMSEIGAEWQEVLDAYMRERKRLNKEYALGTINGGCTDAPQNVSNYEENDDE